MTELRAYQREACDAVRTYWADGGGNPLVDLATGLGKSVVIADLTRSLIEEYRDLRVLMLVHVRELVEQNFKAMLRLWPGSTDKVGINSAGLGRRDQRSQILFASIQSVYKQARQLGPRDLVLIDEVHLVPKAGDGMYRTLIERLRDTVPDLRVAGFTATPFRLDSGRLTHGDDRLFDDIVYSYGIGPGIADGWLSTLVSKASATEIDVSSVAKRGGEFIPGALEAAADIDRITLAATAEIVERGVDRRSWLVFCAGVKHAFHVRDALRARGVHAETVTGETPPAERNRLIRDFREGRLRCLTNAQVLTTGFDAPGTDLVVFLRPTLSTGLYLQMIGRGVRNAPGKKNALVLDFAGNVRRHGPVDAVQEPDRRRKGQDFGDEEMKTTIDSVRAKVCPDCESMMPLNAIACTVCGHEWPREVKPKHQAAADDTPILSTEKAEPEMIPVVQWKAQRWQKEVAPDSLRITYYAGLQTYSEWVLPERAGQLRYKFELWWNRHGGGTAPADVTEALARFGDLTMPATIAVRRNGKFFDVISRTFAAREDKAASA